MKKTKREPGDGQTGRERKERKRKSSSRGSSNPLSPGSAQREYVVVGGQKVYLNFVHARRPGYYSRGFGHHVPHSIPHNPFVKESTLPARRVKKAGNRKRKAIEEDDTCVEAKKKEEEGEGGEEEEDPTPPPAILELRNQIIESEGGRSRGEWADADDDDFEFSIEEFTPPAETIRRRKAAAAEERSRMRNSEREWRDEKTKANANTKDKAKEKGREKAGEEGCHGDGNVLRKGDGKKRDQGATGAKRSRNGESTRSGDQATSRAPSSAVRTQNKAAPHLSVPYAKAVPTSPFAKPRPRMDKRLAAASSASARTPSSPITPDFTKATSTNSDIGSSQDDQGQSEELEITSSFLASIELLEKSMTLRWTEYTTPLDCSSETSLSPSLMVSEGLLRPGEAGNGDTMDHDSQWIDSPFCLSTQAVRAFAATATLSKAPSSQEAQETSSRGEIHPSSARGERSLFSNVVPSRVPSVPLPTRFNHENAPTSSTPSIPSSPSPDSLSASPSSPTSSPLPSAFVMN